MTAMWNNDIRGMADKAIEEAKELRTEMVTNLWLSFTGWSIAIGLMIYFGADFRWVTLVAITAAAFTIMGLLMQAAFAIQIHVTFLEIWAADQSAMQDDRPPP